MLICRKFINFADKLRRKGDDEAYGQQGHTSDTEVVLRLRHIPADAGGDYPSHHRARRLAGADAYGRRQVAVLPDIGVGYGGDGGHRVASHLADEGPGGGAEG